MIDLPTNYYGVAFSIARLRMLLGWEDASGSEALLERTLHHYATHSGTFGFCDDTDGEGRFDRYSILLIAELCERFIETGLEVTPNLLALLRNSVDVVFKLSNTLGDGFCFGRSLGPYADTAMLQILSVASYLKVMSSEEQSYAYSLCVVIVEKYIDFWFNNNLHSVDMWGQGRRVDAYRGKSRILGENLSLLHQIIGAARLWRTAGFGGVVPNATTQLQAWLCQTQPTFSLVPFARGVHDRALAIYRGAGRVFSLLMVNGGAGQHMNSPYYPLPFSPGLVEGVADSGYAFAQLMPKLMMQDGTELMGTAFFRNIRCSSSGSTHRICYELDGMVRLGRDVPIQDDRISCEVEYAFEPGRVTRTENFFPRQPIQISSVTLDFLSFSGDAQMVASQVRFHSGAVTALDVAGLDTCEIHALNDDANFRSPNGFMQTRVRGARRSFLATEPFAVQWTLHYT